MNIGILGISFCGSTLLSFMLGANEKIFSVGESSWLIRNKGKRKCIICNGCEFFTHEFRYSLTRFNLFDSIEKRVKDKYNIDKIIYSDKSANSYLNFIRLGNPINRFIILFKRPEGFVASYIRHSLEKKQIVTVKESLDLYYEHYIANLNISKTITSKIIFYDDLILQPKIILEYICNWLKVPYSDKMISYWNITPKTHQVGGSKNFINKGTIATKKIELDERWKTELTTKNKIEIKENEKIQKLFNKLLNLRGVK